MLPDFINSFRRPENAFLIETIQKGYKAIFNESIEVYHGTGKEFSSFLMDKVGTGEGLQKFGYGLYFTESTEVAKFYAEQAIEGSVIYKVSIPSNLYLAEWDAPADTYARDILQQAEENEWKESDVEDLMDGFGLSDAYRGQPETFGSIYDLIADTIGGQKKASEFLLNAGIDGIKYQSGTLSGMVNDSDFDNYVIFDQNVVKIQETLTESVLVEAVDKFKTGKEPIHGKWNQITPIMNNKPVGRLIYGGTPDGKIWIEQIDTNKDMRRQGIASEMIGELKKMYPKKQLIGIPKNPASEAMFDKLDIINQLDVL